MNEWNLAGKAVLILGGTHGIGLARAEEMTRLGAEVMVVAKNPVEIIPYAFIQADITKVSDRQNIAAQIDRLDILVNNVGMNISKASEDFSLDEINELLDTNFIAGFEMIRLLLPVLKKSRNAGIINVASVAGVFDVGTGSVYASAKAAMIQLTKSLAVEYAPYQIRVNAVSPWYTETRRIFPLLSDDHYKAQVLSVTPQKRIASPAEIASAVVFLAMDKSSYITGHNLVVDGGVSAGRV
jgi:NAD(P)-dependent dehydrogenase (short-subunit alcohol dehydrogenase family)